MNRVSEPPSTDKSILESLNFRGAATQKVKAFIEEEARRYGRSEPWRLPSMRKLAEHLGVSVATVQVAYRKLGEEGIIYTDPNRATYVTPQKQPRNKRVFQVGIDFLQGTEDPNCSWRGGIYGGMLNQALSDDSRIVFHRIPSEKLKAADLKPSTLSCPLDGVILAMNENMMHWGELRAGIPAVHLGQYANTFTKGFVSADLFGAALQAGRAFSASGRRRVHLAGYLPQITRFEAANAFAGLLAGYGESQRTGSLNFLNFGPADDEAKVLKQLFAKAGTAPDAFFCPSDYTAMRLLKILWSMEIKVPEQVSVVSATGLVLMNTDFFTMTRAFQPLAEIGAELVRRLMETMDANLKDPTFPGVYLPCTFGGGSTTLPEENAILGIRY